MDTPVAPNNHSPMDRPLYENTNNNTNVCSSFKGERREKYGLGPKNTAFYMHTSGSTALPKIIPRDTRSVLYAIKETLMNSINKQTVQILLWNLQMF